MANQMIWLVVDTIDGESTYTAYESKARADRHVEQLYNDESYGSNVEYLDDEDGYGFEADNWSVRARRVPLQS